MKKFGVLGWLFWVLLITLLPQLVIWLAESLIINIEQQINQKQHSYQLKREIEAINELQATKAMSIAPESINYYDKLHGTALYAAVQGFIIPTTGEISTVNLQQLKQDKQKQLNKGLKATVSSGVTNIINSLLAFSIWVVSVIFTRFINDHIYPWIVIKLRGLLNLRKLMELGKKGYQL